MDDTKRDVAKPLGVRAGPLEELRNTVASGPLGAANSTAGLAGLSAVANSLAKLTGPSVTGLAGLSAAANSLSKSTGPSVTGLAGLSAAANSLSKLADPPRTGLAALSASPLTSAFAEKILSSGTPRRSSVAVTSATDLGLLVKSARQGMSLSQQQFADLAGVGRRFVSELENGKATLEFGLVLQVCKAAGIDINAERRQNR